MGTVAKEAKLPLPYGPFEGFKSFVIRLKKTVVPKAIDSSMMGNMSGTSRAQLRATLRFFQLTDDDGVVSPIMHSLVSAVGTEAWQTVLGDVIDNAYSDILRDLDITSATLGQLIDRLRTGGGAGGSVLRKATRFYLTAIKEAGIPASPLFHERGLSTVAEGGRAAKSKSPGKPNGNAAPTPAHAPPPPGRSHDPAKEEAVPVKLPGREPLVIYLPLDMSDAEWNYVDAQIRGYLSLRGPK
ncbi:MAG: hypothetical protein ABI601_17550 [bacterium]